MALPESTDVQIKPEFYVPPLNRERSDAGMNEWHGTRNCEHAQHLCVSVIHGTECTRYNCRHMHDLEKFLKERPQLLGDPCPLYVNYGKCPFSFNCRFYHPNQSSPEDFTNHSFDVPLELPAERVDSLFDAYLVRDLRSGVYDTPSKPQAEFSPKVGSLMLAPMCSVGTLPFRRLCKDFGADVTFSEMVLARYALYGNMWELRKMRRGACEDIFGIYLTGTPDDVSRLANMISAKNLAYMVDVNAACPQEAATRFYCGFAIAQRNGRINQILQKLEATGVNATLKTRVGDFRGEDIYDRIAREVSGIKNLRCICIHGRTAKQRYAKTADWGKIAEFKTKLLSAEDAVNGPHPLLIGNGDVFTPADANRALKVADCVMIGRGALIKPWIFREIKEGREIDFSSQERLEMCKKFVGYCLEMYGTDDIGVERAREQFLENWNWMSRYVPLGVRAGEQTLNSRTPPFRGRDDLETLMGSQDAADWVRISELLLGPVPVGFRFQPKHKSKGSFEKADNM